jgi:hypothetical protein
MRILSLLIFLVIYIKTQWFKLISTPVFKGAVPQVELCSYTFDLQLSVLARSYLERLIILVFLFH